MPRRALACGRRVIRRLPAFYFHRSFTVCGEPVETGALPRAGDTLHTGRLHSDACRFAIMRAGLPFPRRASRLFELPGGVLRRLLLFEEQPFHRLCMLYSQDRGGVG